MTFQSPGNPDFGQNSGHFSVLKGPNVKSAKLLTSNTSATFTASWGENDMRFGTIPADSGYYLDGYLGGYASIRDDVPSDAYIKASDKNLRAGTFVTYGSKETRPDTCSQPTHYNISVNTAQQAAATWTWYDVTNASYSWSSNVVEDVLVVGFSKWNKNGAGNSTVVCLGGNLDGTRHEALRFTFESDDWPIQAYADVWLDVPMVVGYSKWDKNGAGNSAIEYLAGNLDDTRQEALRFSFENDASPIRAFADVHTSVAAGNHTYKLQFKGSETAPKVQEQRILVIRLDDCFPPASGQIWVNTGQQPAATWTWYDVTGASYEWTSQSTQDLLIVGFSKWNKNGGGAADINYLAGNLDGARQESLRFSYENDDWPERAFADVRTSVAAGDHTYKLQFLGSSTTPKIQEQRILVLRLN